MKVLLVNGRFALAGGKLVTMADPGAVAPPTSGTLSLTLTDFYTAKTGVQPVVQRKAGTTYADVPVLFTFTGQQPVSVQARVVKAVGGATVVDWTTISSVSVDGSNMLGTLPGVPQGAGYLLQIRDGLNAATASNGSTAWGVGVVFLFQGQSNMVNTLSGGYTDTVPGSSQSEVNYFNAGNVKGAIFDDAGWHAASNGSVGPTGKMNTATANITRFVRIVAARLAALYGYDVPVGIIPYAIGSQTIETFTKPSGTHYVDLFGGSGSVAPDIGFSSKRNIYAGDFEGVFWHQGEANQTDSTASYLAKLTALRQGYLDYVAQFGRSASAMFFGAGVLGNYAPTSCPNIENLRKAVLDSGWSAWTTIDLVRGSGDGLHFTGSAYQKRSMMRCIQSALKWLGCATFSGRGPRITTTTVAQSGNAAVLAVEHEGGTALAAAITGSPITGFYANSAPDFTGTDVAVTATITGPAQITLTFLAGTAYPVYVKHLGGRISSTAVDGQGYTASCNPNISNLVYDNVQYPTGTTGTDVEALGLPLLPTAGAIAVTGG